MKAEIRIANKKIYIIPEEDYDELEKFAWENRFEELDKIMMVAPF